MKLIGKTFSFNGYASDVRRKRPKLWSLIKVVRRIRWNHESNPYYRIERKLSGKPEAPISYYMLKRYYRMW